MQPKNLNEAIAKRFGVPMASDKRKTINRAVRTLPGGNETLDALEALNAARNHAQRNHAADRVIATDAAIDRVEQIRSAMEQHVVDLCSEGEQ